jgi:hypothetical protein
MRLALVAVVGLASPAFAGGHSGGGGGGSGPLGQVSGGLASAAASSSSGSSSSNTDTTYSSSSYASDTYREQDCSGQACGSSRGVVHAYLAEPPGPPASLTGFAGAEKVVGSNGSVSLAMSVVDRKLRFNGSFTEYFENEMSGARVTMRAPELSVGLHLGSDGPTRVWIEGGALYLLTHDPAGDVSLAGPTVGTRIEHQMSPDLSFAGVVEGAYLADGVRGVAGRVGVRFHHVEAAFRVLDLNVGPALYGPEVGIGF